jgi:hypothetical protein
MKQIRLFLASLLFGVLLATVPGLAQASPFRLKVEVPFRFDVGNKTFAAGEYYIISVAPNTLALRDSEYRFLGFFMTGTLQSRERSHTTAVEFAQEGGRRVLKQVWQEGTHYGFEMASRKAAVSLAQAPATDNQAVGSISTR